MMFFALLMVLRDGICLFRGKAPQTPQNSSIKIAARNALQVQAHSSNFFAAFCILQIQDGSNKLLKHIQFTLKPITLDDF